MYDLVIAGAKLLDPVTGIVTEGNSIALNGDVSQKFSRPGRVILSGRVLLLMLGGDLFFRDLLISTFIYSGTGAHSEWTRINCCRQA